MNPLINIQGREAVPVRAIPLLTGWKKMTPDVLAKALAQNDYNNNFGGLTAHRLHPDGRITKTMPQEWSMLVMDLAGISDTIEAGQVSHDAGHMEWRERATQALPAGVFVWRDEFAEQYEKSRYGNGTLSINRNRRAIGLEAVIPPLEFSIDVWPEREGLVFEGFGHVLAPVAVTAQAATSGIQPARASHAQNPPAACFEWLEALELWREFRRAGASSQAVEPLDKGTTWPHALPPLFVAAIQWPDKTPAMKARSAAFASFCKTLPTVPVEWKAPPPMYAVGRGSQWNDFAGRWSDEPTYRRPPNPAPAQPSTIEIDAITAPQAKAIFTGMGVEPAPTLKAWFTSQGVGVAVATPAPAAETVPAKKETAEERQNRRLKMCIDAGLAFLPKEMQRLPDGVGDIADREGVSRQTFSADLRAALKRKYPPTPPRMMQVK